MTLEEYSNVTLQPQPCFYIYTAKYTSFTHNLHLFFLSQTCPSLPLLGIFPAVEKTNACFWVMRVHVEAVIGSEVQFSRGTWPSCHSRACGTGSLSKTLTRATASPTIACHFRRSSRPPSDFDRRASVALVCGSSTGTRPPASSSGDAPTLGRGPTAPG